MQKKNLIVFDIDDTLTRSESQHITSYLNTMIDFGITKINQNWKNYLHHTDSYILKENYEINLKKTFYLDLIPSFEKKMTQKILTLSKTEEILGASAIVNFFMRETDYAICFATGSLFKPALVKLEQAKINFVPDLVEASNAYYSREEIVQSAIEKAKIYFKVRNFKNIISVGDGVWDLKTARNLGIHFLGIGDKNLPDFQQENIKSHITNWSNFDFNKIKKELNIT